MHWYISAILAGTLLLAGCGGGGGSNTINTPTGVSTVNAFPNLSFVAPVFFVGLPGTAQAVVCVHVDIYWHSQSVELCIQFASRKQQEAA